jgi:hypothetical protein
MELVVDKGWVIGPDWDPEGKYSHFLEGVPPGPCPFLWAVAVVNNDGGVAPCCGSFYREDDRGRLSITAGDGGVATFGDVWNDTRFTTARRFFHSREGTPAERNDVCFDCPVTVNWEEFQRHKAAGGDPATFQRRLGTNDAANYFWNRRPVRPEGRSPKVVPLPVGAAATGSDRASR